MTLATLIDAELAFGDLPLLDRAQLSVAAGERIGLIGRNGTGKSSLLAVLAGRRALDDGEVRLAGSARVVLVEQEPELAPTAHLGDALLLRGHVPSIADERERWRIEARLNASLQRFRVDPTRAPAGLSGGERKRAALALAFALEPDLLLLDEPTNHLDIGAIEDLEALLNAEIRGARSCMVITHDRRFLDAVATRIIELDRGQLRSYPGNFTQFEARKQDELAAEDAAQRRFDKFWAEEEVWIRKGIEARRTRNAGRVTRLEALRNERAARRERIGNIKLAVDAGERSGKRVAELKGVCKSFVARTIIRDLDLVIQRGDRLALLGPNGAGKSTLIRLILGELAPDAGSVQLGANLTPAYFDQLRAQLDPDKTVVETIAPGGEWIEVGGRRKHVISYLGDFLFSPRRAASPVKTLSGGERNRLWLARLFAQPANLLVLDEPTNDLDLESLELLEATLADYAGTLIVVSHDRAFLDAVATQTLVAEGDGTWREYVGGYSDWLALRPPPQAAALATPEPRAEPAARSRTRIKLSYKETRELEQLPLAIEALEAEQAQLAARMHALEYHRNSAEQMAADAQRAAQIEQELEAKLERWTALEDKARAAAG